MKTSRILLFCATLLLANAQVAQAQNGTAALDRVVEKFRRSGDLSAAFTLTVYNALNEPVDKLSGTIKLSGDKFYWTTPAMTVWYNGQLQWAYVKATEEVNLTEPTPAEIASINPYTLITTYKQNFNVKALKAKNSQQRVAELAPKKKGTQIDRVVLTVNASTWTPQSFQIYYSDRTHSTIALSQLVTGQNFPDATFVFNKKQYPKAEVIDLR
ncbi:LolA-like putative outer membrane lipoprotein chaperone [Barnesiella viscericola]|uniref:LolA family protein n=1 Tax=Barnesiella viscericola TaxID=397865 RepID=UPI0025A4CC3D|nr:LolA-like putative outer membrane lipoprotein chaperone [Barnesiella viscericola]MDM8268733.1 LolA-like putative outer membrane lipoprotein chaperone [Barnesiella viscericola]